MNVIKTRAVIPVALITAFLALLFLRDIIGVGVPNIVFTVLWLLIIVLCEKPVSAAFTVSAVICFASTLSITIPSAAFIVWILFNRKTLKIHTVFFVSLYIIIEELIRVCLVSSDNFKQYTNSMVVLLLVCIITEELYENRLSDEKILKFYVLFFGFLSFDIIWATAKSLGGLSEIVTGTFRIGHISQYDETVVGLMSMNANGIALMTMVAISSLMLMISKGRIKKRFAIPLIVYFSFVGFLTISKTFLLVYVGFWVLYSLWYVKKNGKNIFKPLALFAVIGILTAAVWNTELVQNVVSRFDSEDITTGRVDVIFEYLSYMANNTKALFVGIGLQNITDKTSIIRVPHNAILEIFVCFGIVGILAYAAFFIALIRSAIKHSKKTNEKNIFINFIPFIVFFVFIQSLQFLRINYIYASIAIVYACMLMTQKRKKSLSETELP